MLQIDKTQNGEDREVSVGESFEVRLAENPTTGYRWFLNAMGQPALTVENDLFEPSTAAVGGGGIRRWQFRAAHAGIASLVLDNKREWEALAVDTFRLTVHVRPR